MNIKLLTRTALFMAIVTVTTMVINIPIPATKGYVNASEIAVFLSAALLPFAYNTFAGGTGCALADILLGYSLYAPATLVIKAIEAFIAFKLLKKFKLNPFVAFGIACIFMPAGYFLYEFGILRYTYETALAALIPNLLQGLFGAIGAGIVYPFLKKLSI